MEIFEIALIFGALLLGAAAGWFVGSRPVAEWRLRFEERNGEAKAAVEKVSRMAPELATMSDRAARADGLAEMLDRSREELTGLKAQAAGFAEQKRLLEESREKLLKEFENTGAQVLGKAQEAFLTRANERFKQSEEVGEQRIKALLEPVGLRLKNYEEQVAMLEAKRVDAFGQLTGLIDNMQKGQEEVRREAQRLGNSLTNAPKARGRWGERALQNVLEQCGLSQHTDFNLEQSVDTADGRLRPDAIVNVPGQKKLIIDAKVSLNAYQEAFEADDDDVRKLALGAHAKSMRNHVQTLGAKSYQSQFEDAPDYVVMFVPGEHFIAAALEADPDLWDFAFQNGVLLASPTNLVAIARTIAQVWRQDQLADEAREIGKAGAELYSRLETASQHLKRMGSGLESAVKNYNSFVGSFERNVLSSAKRLSEKGIEVGKREIEEVPLVESAPRYTAADVADETAALPDQSKDASTS
ncbi:DNA recombination protein RmuC [Pontixanthobacter gangjinensis]|uniref:DNA recombination protein RmuC homolog n=1 Tax=Pontixanthobacter gangjinensis TaxID=1028742 RepID=A0A6I4SL49_9SPHN|nr:DNA recombination protein RmuC [Pontixanthobacter gangjinensis]MXO56489.1 DNA recombination protein RmuC [Pontixanthobacter gangjinensis]